MMGVLDWLEVQNDTVDILHYGSIVLIGIPVILFEEIFLIS